MTQSSPPKFEKRRHHFVPQFWLRGFRDANGHLWQRRNGAVSQAAIKDTMSEDWLYAVFDDWWRPSDDLEDAFSGFEGAASDALNRVGVPGAAVTEADWNTLLLFLGLTACRHPDTFARGGARARELSWILADVHSFADKASFDAALEQTFGPGMPSETYDMLRQLSPEELLEQAEHIEGLSPQDPSLPQQDAVRATMTVARGIGAMDLDLLDAPAGTAFVLSDRPLPMKDLSLGFTVPLSSSLALQARPTIAGVPATQHRSVATPSQVAATNAEQVGRAKTVIIGGSRTLVATAR